jgi:hypothetical protein
MNLEELRKNPNDAYLWAITTESIVQNLRELARIKGDPAMADQLEDAVSEIYEIFDVATVGCSLCGGECPGLTAHLHQKSWIGDACCWTEQLRSSE